MGGYSGMFDYRFYFSSSDDINRSRRCAKRFSSTKLPIAISEPPARNVDINNFRNIHVVLAKKVWQQNKCLSNFCVHYDYMSPPTQGNA